MQKLEVVLCKGSSVVQHFEIQSNWLANIADSASLHITREWEIWREPYILFGYPWGQNFQEGERGRQSVEVCLLVYRQDAK